MSMMNPQGPDGEQEGQSAWTPPMSGMAQGMEAMQLMTQMFQMQMQLAQMMWMMPMQLMQGMAAGMTQMGAAAQKEGAAQPGGFQLGGMTIPPALLQKLLQMDMSPENLEKLQKVLDFLFAAIPDNKDQ